MELVKTKFFFKGKTERDGDGNPVMVPAEKVIKGKDGQPDRVEKDEKKLVPKIIKAPDPLETNVPLLTVQDIVDIIQKGEEKQLKLLTESLNNTILEQAREQVNAAMQEGTIEDLRSKGLDLTVLSWEAIANLPPATRRGSAIPEEKWEKFAENYVSVMVHHGKTEEKAKMGAKLLVQKYQPVKMNHKVIRALKENLQLWFTNTDEESREEFQDVYENLMSKADTLLEKDEDAVLAAV